VANIFGKVGLEIIDAIPQTTHGGSMRYILAAKGKYPIHTRVTEQLKIEDSLQLHEPTTYLKFKQNCERSKANLFALLENLAERQLSVVGYAATSKSTTIINYCNITNKHLQYICDTTPIKQNKFSPGAHIPVRSHTIFTDKYPDYAVLFAWNHSQEIFAKEGSFIKAGGKWITFVPEVKILE
jgi:methylation protein EvaC